MERYDLCVIGCGPGGQKAAVQAAKLGRRVLVVDRRRQPGGVCVHTGTIPSKALREAALHLTGYRLRGVYGPAYRVKEQITLEDVLFRAHHVIQRETEVVRAQLQRNRIALLEGSARFLTPHRVEIQAEGSVREIEADVVVVAPGTVPARPKDVCFSRGRVVDSDGLLELERLPRTMTVVGAGVVGAEYATIFATLGVQVTLIDGRDRLLDFCDAEIAEALGFHARSLGITLRMGEECAAIDCPPGDGPAVLRLKSGKRLAAESVLFCAGRVPATANLDLQSAGLSADARGRLVVDENFRTTVPHIYAVGDVIGFPSLASAAMEQGRRAAAHAFGGDASPSRSPLPFGIFTVPEISMVGASEAELTKKGVPYEVGRARYGEIARGVILGDENGLLKLIFHAETGHLLGVHAMGDGATEIIHVGQAVMALGGTIDYLAHNVFNYPTLCECYRVAALDGMNRVAQLRLAA